jgi:hypothetical protein
MTTDGVGTLEDEAVSFSSAPAGTATPPPYPSVSGDLADSSRRTSMAREDVA